MKSKKLIFMAGGAIGDLLVISYFLRLLQNSEKYSQHEFYIVVAKNYDLSCEILRAYNIKVVDGNKVTSLARFIFSGATVFTQPTFTYVSFKIKFFAKIFSLFTGEYYGFKDNNFSFLCSKLLDFDYSISIVELYKRIAKQITKQSIDLPVKYLYNKNIIANCPD